MRHDAIADAAVIGLPDARWGEQVVACVVPKPGCTLDVTTVVDWVGAHIAGYKRPRRVEFVAAIPRNVSGKILKDAVALLIDRGTGAT
jgi:acyl-CoA synthetase (AMP-forming)/AMP-acid ligase II